MHGHLREAAGVDKGGMHGGSHHTKTFPVWDGLTVSLFATGEQSAAGIDQERMSASCIRMW